jgi:hypothetical protein
MAGPTLLLAGSELATLAMSATYCRPFDAQQVFHTRRGKAPVSFGFFLSLRQARLARFFREFGILKTGSKNSSVSVAERFDSNASMTKINCSGDTQRKASR